MELLAHYDITTLLDDDGYAYATIPGRLSMD
jgi:hypothetical protein